MNIMSTMRYFAGIIRYHPDLVRLYFRNRWRETMLWFDHRRTDGISRYPRTVTLKLTLACNLRCKMCAFNESGQVMNHLSESLSLEEWKAVVDDVARFRPYICITGGEPLLYPDLPELLAHIKRRGLTCTVTTNGSMLPKRAADLMECPPNMIVVSIDGPAEVHDEIRGTKGTFERAYDGVKAIQSIKLLKKTRMPSTVVTCAVTPYNHRAIEEMPGIARELGVDVMNFQHQWVLTSEMVEAHNRLFGDVHPMSYEEMGGMEPPAVDAEELGQAVDRIRRLGRVSGRQYIGTHPLLDSADVRTWYGDLNRWIKRGTPACAWMGVSILPNGDVEACPGMITGNVTREPLTGIWNNEAFREHRKRLLKSKGFPICLRCCRFFRVD